MKLLLILFTGMVTFSPVTAQKKVLVEILTNSHCPLCPAAYTTVNNYLKTAGNSEKIIPVFLHMPFPYNDDQLYKDNTSDASARSSYYGISSSTPRGIFDGALQTNSYSNWAATLNSISSSDSPITLTPFGKITDNVLEVTVDIERTGTYSQTDLNVFIMLVENLNYSGRNGISRHTNVVRRILAPNGSPLILNSIGEKTTITQSVAWDSRWVADSTALVVFVQGKSGKAVLQSEMIRYPYSVPTAVSENESEVPIKTSLLQNYPNPFNPSTTIRWYLDTGGPVSIKIFNVIGQQVGTILNQSIQPTGHGEIDWKASGLPTGLYIIRMETASGTSTIRSLLMK
ncbi:MAG: T9SS type A sorting domain-containing protein [Bacteroidetes bacterium]|nr:T9SS type A sorting domain-containing protein [Bacteroidota bacterium]